MKQFEAIFLGGDTSFFDGHFDVRFSLKADSFSDAFKVAWMRFYLNFPSYCYALESVDIKEVSE